jgi:hypothetical protein
MGACATHLLGAAQAVAKGGGSCGHAWGEWWYRNNRQQPSRGDSVQLRKLAGQQQVRWQGETKIGSNKACVQGVG